MSSKNPFHTGIIMRLSLFASLILHFGFFLSFRNAFPFDWNKNELRTYQVELLRPPTNSIKPEDLAKAELEQMKKETPEEEKPELAEKEDTISLDTKDKRYLGYTTLIKEKIRSHWHYPVEAKGKLMEGKAHLLFSLNKNGELLQIKITLSSGHEILDQEGIRAITEAAPFPPFPDQVGVVKLHIKAILDYRLNIK